MGLDITLMYGLRGELTFNHHICLSKSNRNITVAEFDPLCNVGHGPRRLLHTLRH